MNPPAEVRPNRRGVKSRERVLDAAERIMAEHGVEAATLARVVEESGIPMSSVYHYFGSKDRILLAGRYAASAGTSAPRGHPGADLPGGGGARRTLRFMLERTLTATSAASKRRTGDRHDFGSDGYTETGTAAGSCRARVAHAQR